MDEASRRVFLEEVAKLPPPRVWTATEFFARINEEEMRLQRRLSNAERRAIAETMDRQVQASVDRD